MSPITKIAFRRLKNNITKSVSLVIAIFISMTMISLFVFFELQTTMVENPSHAELPFGEFMGKLRLAMTITIVFLVAITFITVRIHCGIRNEDNLQTLAVLTSVGATGSQKRRLLVADILLLYLPPIVLGVIVGIVPGIKMGNSFVGISGMSVTSPMQYIAVAALVVASAFFLVLLCNYLPSIRLKRRSVIQSVKKQNIKASEERHGYRESRTYRSQPILKRLAKKSIDYYVKTYNRIAVAFATAALYPMISGMLFWLIGKSDVVVDNNPYDGIDTATAVIEVIYNLFVFFCISFLALTIIGIMQALLMARIQVTARKSSTRAYLSIGMTPEEINKLIHFELRSVVFRVLILLIFSVVIIGGCYSIV